MLFLWHAIYSRGTELASNTNKIGSQGGFLISFQSELADRSQPMLKHTNNLKLLVKETFLLLTRKKG